MKKRNVPYAYRIRIGEHFAKLGMHDLHTDGVLIIAENQQSAAVFGRKTQAQAACKRTDEIRSMWLNGLSDGWAKLDPIRYREAPMVEPFLVPSTPA